MSPGERLLATPWQPVRAHLSAPPARVVDVGSFFTPREVLPQRGHIPSPRSRRRLPRIADEWRATGVHERHHAPHR